MANVLQVLGMWVGFLVFFASACSQGEGNTTEFITYDSAGVQIAENVNVGREDSPLWTLSEEPVLEIGTLHGEGGALFHQVSDATLTRTGGIAVSNRGSREVRLFDANGNFLRSLGRRGEGPGEFQSLTRIWSAGDSVIAFDVGLNRSSVYTLGGEFVRSFQPDLGDGIIQQRGVFSDGSFLFESWGSASIQEIGDLYQSYLDFFRVSRDGTDRHPILTEVPRALSFDLIRPPGIVERRAAYFAPHTSAAVTLDGIYVGTAESHEVALIDSEGRLVRRIRWDGAVRPITAPDRSRYVDWRVGRIGSEEGRDRLRAEAAGWVFAPNYMAYFAVHADRLGNLWVRPFDPPWEELRSPWLVFSREGGFLARIVIPRDLEVFEIGEDYVLTLTRDEFDAEYVRMYELVKHE